MLHNLPIPQPDPLWAVLSKMEQDQRNDKLDLIVGVYRDENGVTPTMQAVQLAEQRLANEATSKAYKGLSGNTLFNESMTRLLVPNGAIAKTTTIQTVGGTGALRLLFDFIYALSPSATVWISNPGYINHEPIAQKAGLKTKTYPYLDSNGQLDEAAMLDHLSMAKPGDVVVLHGCCHNPSGVDLSEPQWKTLASLLASKQLIPLVDIAYLGLSDTMENELKGLHYLIGSLETVFIAASCSKNMGLYCERTGCAMVVSNTSQQTAIRSLFEQIARSNYSMPPEHGAAIAHLLLSDPTLNSNWQGELTFMRNRINYLRQQLSLALQEDEQENRYAYLASGKGMFSLLPFSSSEIDMLATRFGIYGTKTGRINIAGLKESQIPYLAEAIRQLAQH